MMEAILCRTPMDAAILELPRLELLQDENITYCHHLGYCTRYHFSFAARALVFVVNNSKQAEALVCVMLFHDFDESCITIQWYLCAQENKASVR